MGDMAMVMGMDMGEAGWARGWAAAVVDMDVMGDTLLRQWESGGGARPCQTCQDHRVVGEEAGGDGGRTWWSETAIVSGCL